MTEYKWTPVGSPPEALHTIKDEDGWSDDVYYWHESDTVLVQLVDDSMITAIYIADDPSLGEVWVDANCGDTLHDVVAWMPLPTVYKG